LPDAHLLLPILMGFHCCHGSSCTCNEGSKTSSVQSKDEQAATPSCVSGSRRRPRGDCLHTNAQHRHMDHPPHGLACFIRSLNPSIERMELPCSTFSALESPTTRSTHFAQPSRLPHTLESSNRPTSTRYRILLKPSVAAKGSAVVMCLTIWSLTTWPYACTSPYFRS
jgi:hypothetical protein